MNIIAIIPARMGSSRFPGKPLADLNGMPMVGHVLVRTKRSETLSETYVATCDQEIFDYVESVGGKAVMTADTHERCTDRAAEAMLKIEEATGEKVDIVVIIQGDEPLVTPKMIDQAVTPMLENPEHQVLNLMSVMGSQKEFEDPNEVKVVAAPNGDALYFSREPIPSRSKWDGEIPMMKQVCIMPFRRDYLLKFNEMPEMPLERIESVDMLRILEHGGRVHMELTEEVSFSVDTPADLEHVKKVMQSDNLVKEYLDA
ncbi:MAG: 3-deoxy-manno-octulosonate cytidylyltransferase [Pseudodesulfovibrio sp.]|nr:3-deoxy-manno-octulosonate cytidylyltransferase [Pseudodesulfovibrio sp.]